MVDLNAARTADLEYCHDLVYDLFENLGHLLPDYLRVLLGTFLCDVEAAIDDKG